MSSRRAWILPGTALGLILCAGCATNRDPEDIPRFRRALPRPVAIRIVDERPPTSEIDSGSKRWLYYRTREGARALELAQKVGNALNVFRATPGYSIVKPSVPDNARPFLIHLTYLEGYARWPVNVDRDKREAPVEAACEIAYEVFYKGKRVKRGSHKSAPPDFKVPLNIIRADNVDRVVRESLAHQYDKATAEVLDAIMFDLAKLWPEYAARKP